MWEEFLGQVLANGVWATMFVFLLIYVLRDSKVREQAYMETVKALTDRLKVVEDVAVVISAIASNTDNILYELTNRGSKWKVSKKSVMEGEKDYESKNKVEIG